MFCDYHVHTNKSPDSPTPLINQLKQAKLLGLTEICLTEHLEINFPGEENWRLNVNDYIDEYKAEQHEGIKVKFGVEAGISCLPEEIPILEAELRSAPLDFVLASCHLVNRLDPFNPIFFENKTIQESFSLYIATINQQIRLINPILFSAVAHIDFISKGSHTYPDPRLKYSYAKDEIDELFKYIISIGKCIEINTSSYKNLGDLSLPGFDWLKRYVELGGEHITIGSDAHSPEYIAYRIEDAAELARNAGIKYFATYNQMVPEFHKL